MLDRDEVQLRLEEAGATLMAMPSGMRGGRLGSGMPTPVREAIEAYGWTGVRVRLARPSPEAIDRMDEALLWVSLIPADPAGAKDVGPYSLHGGVLLRRIVWARMMVDPMSAPSARRYFFSWARLAQIIGADRRCLPGWHKAGLGYIAERAESKHAA